MIKRFTQLFTLAAFVLLSTTGLSAQRDCGAHEMLQQAIQDDPTTVERMEKMEEFIEEYTENMAADDKMLVTIPVVVHVVYRTNAQNISAAQVNSQIDVLNEDFRRLNADRTNRWGQAADIEVEFCLATVDPNGNPTSGITRTQTNESGFDNDTKRVHRNSTGGKDAWPRGSYMNMWVCDLFGGGLGYAQFPNTGVAATDGIVIDYAYFGRGGSAQAPFNLGRTATHEVGHWLNIFHIWGDNPRNTNGCNYDDAVSDTPNQAAPSGGCPNSTTCGSADMVENYMDYSNDACMNLFTQGQKNRMRATLAGFRSSLANSNGCGTPGGGGGGACNDNQVDLRIVADNYGNETTWTLSGPNGTVATGGPYANNSTNNESFCLPDGCYTFTINDEYGDGICCQFGNGSYSLTGSGVSESGGSFTFTESKQFCVGSTGGGGGGGCTDITFATDDFESNYGNWNDGGSDCVRSRTRPIQGGISVYLRDDTNTSVLTSDPYNLSSLEELTVDFSYYPYSMESGERFFLQVDNGSGFQTVQTWTRGTDFNNNTRYDESVTITGNFGTNVRVRFRCDASANSDYVHLDNIVLGGCQSGGSRINLNGSREFLSEQPVESDDAVVVYEVFPNPTAGDLNVRIDAEGYTARLTSVTGRVLAEQVLTVGSNQIKTGKLSAGMYLMVLEGADGFREVEKVVVR